MLAKRRWHIGLRAPIPWRESAERLPGPRLQSLHQTELASCCAFHSLLGGRL